MGRSFGEDYLRWSAEWQSPLRGHLLFDHAREPANFVASRGNTTGRSELGDNGGRVEGVSTGLSEPGEISSVTPRAQRKAARVSPRGFYEG